MNAIEGRIFLVRGMKVMLGPHLAELYEVRTKALMQAVRRNLERFPSDFMIRLTWREVEQLRPVLAVPAPPSPRGTSKSQIPRSQFVTLESGKNVKYLPFAFTEQGIAMLSSVLRSPRAIRVNIEVMRAFVRLRSLLGSHADLARRIKSLERKCDGRFRLIFDALRRILEPPGPARPRIGFHPR